MSRYIVLNGKSRNSLNINAVKKISSPLGRQQWLNLFAKNPRILTSTDRVVILNNKSSSLTFRFNVSLYGNYDIFVRCIAPSTSTNTAIVKLDNSRAKILDLARRPRQYVLQQVTVKMFSNIALNAGVHKITFGYKEPIGLIRLIVKKKNSNAPPIIIPSIDVALNPTNIYTEPIEQPPTELTTPEPIIDAEYITVTPEPIIPPIADEPIEDVITPVEEIASETPSPEPIYEIVSPEPIYEIVSETPFPEPIIYETTSPKPVAKKATALKTESEKEEPMATWKIVLIVIFSIIILAIIVYFMYRYYSRRTTRIYPSDKDQYIYDKKQKIPQTKQQKQQQLQAAIKSDINSIKTNAQKDELINFTQNILKGSDVPRKKMLLKYHPDKVPNKQYMFRLINRVLTESETKNKKLVMNILQNLRKLNIVQEPQKTFQVVNPMLQGKSQRQFGKTQDKTFQVVNPMFQGKTQQQFVEGKKQLSEQDLYQSYRNLFKQYQQKLSEQEMFQSFRNLMQGKEQPPDIARKLKNVKTFPTRKGFLNLAQVLINAEKRKLKKPEQAQTNPIQINFSPEINVNTAQQKQQQKPKITADLLADIKALKKDQKQQTKPKISADLLADIKALAKGQQQQTKPKITADLLADIKALKKDQQQQTKPKTNLLADISKGVFLKPIPKQKPKKEQKGSNLLEQLTKKIGGRRVSPVYVSQEDLKKPKTEAQAPLKLDQPVVLSKQQRDKLKRRAAATTYQRQDQGQDQDQQWLD